MNYARFSRTPFVSSKPVNTKRADSTHSRAVAEFCATHQVSVSIDPSTNRGTVQVTENERNRSE